MVVDSLTLANHYRDSSVFAAFASVLRIPGDQPATLNSCPSIMEETSEASSEAEGADFQTALSPSHRKRNRQRSGSALSDPLVSSDSSSTHQKLAPSGSSTDSFFRFGKRRQSSTHAVAGACVRFWCSCKNGTAAFCRWLLSLRSMKWRIQLVKLEVLLTRAWRVLLRRDKLILGSTLVVVYFAVMFGAMLGKSTDDAIAVASMFGMGNLVIILSNLPLIFFMYHNHQVPICVSDDVTFIEASHGMCCVALTLLCSGMTSCVCAGWTLIEQVFLREHSRGLYSSLSHWYVSDNPIMLLRVVQGVCYGFVIHVWLQLRGGGESKQCRLTWTDCLSLFLSMFRRHFLLLCQHRHHVHAEHTTGGDDSVHPSGHSLRLPNRSSGGLSAFLLFRNHREAGPVAAVAGTLAPQCIHDPLANTGPAHQRIPI